MSAFVPSGGLAPSALQSGLRSVCGTRAAPAPQPASSSTTVRMIGDSTGITLQRLLYEPSPGESCVEDKDIMCAMVWKQVFGNAYVMESERAEAYKFESMYRAGRINVREFVRGVALSNTYRRRFYDCCTPWRAAELNFKHLLGRAPNTKAEIAEHATRIANDGFEADINSFIDSEEYDLAFGDDYVPGRRFKGTYPTIEEFNSMCSFYSAAGTTDKSLSKRAAALGISNPNRVLSLDGAGTASKYMDKLAMKGKSSFVGVKRGIPGRANVDFGEVVEAATVNPDSNPGRRVEIVPGSYMYLTASEEKAFAEDQAKSAKVIGLAEKELADAKVQQQALAARIQALEACI